MNAYERERILLIAGELYELVGQSDRENEKKISPLWEINKIIKPAADGGNYMPPVFTDGSFRDKYYGLLEYRFMHIDKQKSVYGHSKEECFRKRAELIAGNTKRKPRKEPEKPVIFADFFREWMETYKKPVLQPTSYYIQGKQSNKYILPAVGKMQLKAVGTTDLQKIINGIESPNAKKKVISCLSDFFKKCLALQKIKHNPMLAIEYSIPKAKHYEALQFEQQAPALAAISKRRNKELFYFCCCTGLRPGEAHGLDIADIDFKRNVIYVHQQGTTTGESLSRVKSDAGERRVPFHPSLFDYVKIDLTQKKLFGDLKRNESDREINAELAALGYKNVKFYSARHTFVSNCYHAKISAKHIQAWAGHEDITTTMNTYTHLLEGSGTSPFFEYILRLKAGMNI